MNVDTLCVSCMEDDSGSPTCPKCGALFQLPHTNLLLLTPRTLLHQQYVIGRALGHGGFGVTYLAWDIGLKIRLAIKEYMPSGVAGRSTPNTVHAASERMKDEYEWGLDRFLEEARVLKKFSTNPNIVAVDTIFRDNGTAYMVMEYLDGMTFEEFLSKRGGKVTFETSLRIMVPIMDTLAAVHAEGILHRDVSPDNIHLAKSGKVKLMDFGAARNALSQKSRNLSVILKEGYAPEEQYRSSGIQGPWTDVYATAATLYHSITGKLPPPALDRAAEDNLESPSQLGVAIAPASERALLKALAVRAVDRFQSMEDFKDGLIVNAAPPAPAPVMEGAAMVRPPSAPAQPPPMPQQTMPQQTMPQQRSAAPPPLAGPPPFPSASPTAYPNYPPAPQQSYSPPPPPTPPTGSSSRKWVIPVVVAVLVVLAGGAAATFKYGPDLLSSFSNKEETKGAPAPNPPPAEPPAQPQTDQDRQRQLEQAQSSGDPQRPQAQAPQPAAPAPRAVPSSPPSIPSGPPADRAPAPPTNPVAPRPATPPPPVRAPASPTSGVLRYSGAPVPFNGKVVFENLPAARLKFTFDTDSWQPIIARQTNGTQTLTLVSLKHGLQSKCEVTWQMVP